MVKNPFNRTSSATIDPPWILEAKKVFGLHEKRDKTRLTEWLGSDGKRLGDTEKLPWCGDFTETAVKKSLPKEPFTGPMAENPYWARNWLKFGVETTPVYGAVIVFARGTGGHVGFVVGEDDTDYYVLGGNQSDAVNIARIAKNRALGTRWPSTVPNPKRPLPKMKANGIPKTTNEF